MEGMDLGLSPGFRLEVMAGYAGAVNRYGVWCRTATLAIILSAACFAHPLWRAVQLLPVTAGLVFAWMDVYPPESEVLFGSRRLKRWLEARTTDVKDIATPNLAGLLEGFGVVAGALLFAGPLPVSIPQGARLAGIIALTAYCLNAFSQVTVDPGYYRTDAPPARWVIAVRWLLPAATAASAFVMFAGVGAAGSAASRVPFWAATSLACSFLLIWPFTGAMNLLLRYARLSAAGEVTRNLGVQQYIHHEYVHSAKNELRPIFRRPATDAEYDAFSAAVMTVENARRAILTSATADYDDARSAAQLWDAYWSTIDDQESRCLLRFADDTDGRKLPRLEGLILQSILVSFVSNALRARPQQVVVAVSTETCENGVSFVHVAVDDDGTGGAPHVFKKGSSLARLDDTCRQRAGSVHIASRDCGGTQATATFGYPYWLIRKTGKAIATRREAMRDG